MKRRLRVPSCHEWNFWRINNALSVVQRFVWQWEIDRELGSGNPPFLSLPNKAQKTLAARLTGDRAALKQPLREFHPSTQAEADHPLWHYLMPKPNREGHLLEIDWDRFSKREIVEAFEAWVDSRPNHTKRILRAKYGRRAEYLHRLFDLAILRLSQAGVTHREGQKLFGETFPNPRPQGLPITPTISPTHWSDAKRQAAQDIRNRLYELKTLTLNLSRVAGESADWRDHFARLPTN